MPRLTISYRRADSQDITGRIFDRLASYYGRESVFRDIDNIRPGIDFREQISDALQRTDVLLVVVGPKWLGRAKGSAARIDDEADLVRIELEIALKRRIPVIPILVGGMRMPATLQLPESLKDFAFRHASTIDGGQDFDVHVERLRRDIDRLLADKISALAPLSRPIEQRQQKADAKRGDAEKERRRTAEEEQAFVAAKREDTPTPTVSGESAPKPPRQAKETSSANKEAAQTHISPPRRDGYSWPWWWLAPTALIVSLLTLITFVIRGTIY